MPSVPLASQSPATGIVFGQLPAYAVTFDGETVPPEPVPPDSTRICHRPLRYTARSSTLSPLKSPTTGKPRGSPNGMVIVGAPGGSVLLSLKTPASNVPGVRVP